MTLHLTRGGNALFIRASINARDVGWFLIDTGSHSSMIDTAVARRLGLASLASVKTNFSVGSQNTPVFSVSLSAGDLALENYPIYGTDFAGYSRNVGFTLAGVLGVDAFEDRPYTLDFPAATLTLHDRANFRPPAGDAVPLRESPAGPIIRATLEDVTDWFEIDSGNSGGLMLNSDFARQHYELIRRPHSPMPGFWSGQYSSLQDVEWTSFFYLGQHVSPCFGHYTQSQPEGSSITCAGLIGAGLLQDHAITIDSAQHKLWFSRLDREAPDDFIARFGGPNAADLSTFTTLFRAITAHRPDIVRVLLERGADPSPPNYDQWKPLMLAARSNDLESARLLIDHGAPVNIVSLTWPDTALNIAARSGNTVLVQLLLDHYADPSAATATGYTPLHFAAARNHPEIIRLLLARHVPVDIKLPDGCTPLMLACYIPHNNPEIAKVLLDAGADPNSPDQYTTPIVRAAAATDATYLRLLLSHGGNPSAPDPGGFTPLASAATDDSIDCARLLLAAGAKPDVRDKHGKTSLDYAADRHATHVLKLLLAATRPFN